MAIQFSQKHLDCFSRASFDVNPVHLSDFFARKTAFGERLVFGVLGTLACLREVKPKPNQVCSEIHVEYKGPAQVGVEYEVSVAEQRSGVVKVSLKDGSVTKATARLRFADGQPQVVRLPEVGGAPRLQARQARPPDFIPHRRVEGWYGPGEAAYRELLDLLGIERELWGDALLAGLLCASYATGMEAPGENAALMGISAQFGSVMPQVPAAVELSVEGWDERFSIVDTRLLLSGDGGPFCEAQIRAAARPTREQSALVIGGSAGQRFAGKTAVVVGASRGLGATIALVLVAEGCTVVGVYHQSTDAAREVQRAAEGLPGCLLMEQGDPASVEWCGTLKDQVQREFGRLDLLVCNAAPPAQPMRIEPAFCERINSYVRDGFALVSAPVTALLDLLATAKGRVVLISSSYVDETPGLFPQYVAMKAAAEGFVRTAAAAHPAVQFAIARPGRMRTDMTNTPSGWLDAEEPAVVAGRILSGLRAMEAGTVQVLAEELQGPAVETESPAVGVAATR